MKKVKAKENSQQNFSSLDCLTKKELELFYWLTNYFSKEKIVPSIQEISTGINLSVTATIYRLKKLRKKKVINWIDGKKRSLYFLYPSAFDYNLDDRHWCYYRLGGLSSEMVSFEEAWNLLEIDIRTNSDKQGIDLKEINLFQIAKQEASSKGYFSRNSSSIFYLDK